jgi:HSP20 family protein
MARTKKKTETTTTKANPQSAAKRGSELPTKQAAPAASITSSFQELERVFEDFLNRRWPRAFGFEWPRFAELPSMLDRPSVDIVDGETDIVVRAELPGVEKKDLDVSIVDRTLTIKGSSRKEEKQEKKNYFRREIKTGSFSRSILLPADVNANQCEATFKGGVLELKLPKSKPATMQKIPLTS